MKTTEQEKNATVLDVESDASILFFVPNANKLHVCYYSLRVCMYVVNSEPLYWQAWQLDSFF